MSEEKTDKNFKCKLGMHQWEGCRCSVCGKQRDSDHDYEVIERTQTEAGSCRWSAGDPCTGPYCGTPCDSASPSTETIVERCRICGDTRTFIYEGNEPRAQFGW